MRRIKLTLEYDGSDFFGWQLQAKTGERTVQGVLEEVLKSFPKAKPRMMGAGRTDAGVHALGMVAHYDTEDDIPLIGLAKAFNARLPTDVRILKAEEVSFDFEAQFSCCYRRYLYKMSLAQENFSGMALDRKRMLFLRQKLNVTAMIEAAPLFEGKRDVIALASQEERSSVREVYLCRLLQEGHHLALHVAADGFLRNMVRAMVGTLIYVGEGKIKPEEIVPRLESRDRHKMGPTAPAQGLYFVEAGYEAWQG
ncbi:MAG: tRNA pseudouridine(38-40) synthase TruA [Deinococcales bacterium]